ncbi:MAG: hypothetical protein ACFB15_19180 [Cyclobacteriaceae bacterium]
MRLLYLIVLPLFIIACSPSTQITASWQNPDMEDSDYQNILVAAMTRDLEARSTVEGELAVALQEAGVKVTNSGKLFTPSETNDVEKNRDMMLEKIRQNGSDAILTVALLDEKSETRYVPGAATYAPTVRYGFYGGFYNYYDYRYPMVYDPGYYTQDKTYFLESNLYDAETEELLWTAQSRTYNPANLDKFAEEFARVIVSRLQKEDMI